MGYAILIVNRERFAPVTLTAENGIAQAVVHFHLAYTLALNEALCGGYRILHFHTVEVEAVGC